MLLRKLKRILYQNQKVRFQNGPTKVKSGNANRYTTKYSTVDVSPNSLEIHCGTNSFHVIETLNKCCRELIQLSVQTEELKERTESQSITKSDKADLMKMRKITREIQQGLPEAECLVVINDYVKSLELELEHNKKLVKAFSCKNRNLQKRVLYKHQEWLSRIHECELLQKQLEAWRFALSLHDSSYSCLQQLINNPVEAQHNGSKTESDVPGNFSNLPWIWLAEDKGEFLAKVNKLIIECQLPRAVQVTLAAFDLHKLYPASQRHRWVSYYAVELTKAVEYLSELSLRCYQEKSVKMALICANHAVQLLLRINYNRSLRSARNSTTDINFTVLIRNCLTSALIQETEWAILLEATRKLIQVFWLTSRFDEVTTLLFAIIGARRDLIGSEVKRESWKGCSQLSCLLSGGLCLFTGQITQMSFITFGCEDHMSLWFSELAVIWLEASLAVSFQSYTDQINKTQGLECHHSPSFTLWTMMMENLARHCANVGAVYDVVLIAVRVLSVLCRFEPWRTSCALGLTQLLPIVLTAEAESQDVPTKQVETYDLNPYMKGIRCTELNGALETCMKELVLVCRGQQWTTAAALLEWWVTGCQLHRQNMEVRRRRRKSHFATGHCSSTGTTNNSKPENEGCTTISNKTSTRTKNRIIHAQFLNFLIQVQVSNDFHVSCSDLGQTLSQISVGKYRDGSPDEILCNFSGSSHDPRSICFLPTLKQIMPMCMTILEQLTTKKENSDKLAENSFILTSNRKLFKWWKQSVIFEKQSEVAFRYSTNPFLDRTGFINLWDDALRLAESELSSVLPIKQAIKMKTSVTQSAKLNQRLSVQPLPVTKSLAILVRAEVLQQDTNVPSLRESIANKFMMTKRQNDTKPPSAQNHGMRNQLAAECSSSLETFDVGRKCHSDCWNSLRQKSKVSYCK